MAHDDERSSRIARLTVGSAALAAILCTLAAQSSTHRVAMVTEGTNLSVALSPDGKTIIMDLQETLWSLPFAGGTAKRLTEPMLEPARPDWSPKGDAVAFQSFKGGTFHIWLMKPDGSSVRQLTEGHGDDREPRFSPDGKKVAFASDRAFQGSYDIWVADVDSGKLTRWTSGSADEIEPTWLPDGARIAFVSGTGPLGGSIQEIDGAGGTAKMLVASHSDTRLNAPAFSPDGHKLAYTRFSGNTTRMMVAELCADCKEQVVGRGTDVFPFAARWLSNDRLVYTGDGKIVDASLSDPAGKAIPFQTKFEINKRPYKHKQHDFDSTAVRHAMGILSPALSPDGKRVVFEALNQLWVMEIGGKPQAVTNDGFYKQSPAWSPDGTRIAFCSDKAGTADVYVLDLATRAQQRVTKWNDAAELKPAWSPDGSRIAFEKQDGALFAVELATGEVKTIAKATYEPGRASWSSDGKHVSMAALRAYSHRFREGTSLIQTVDVATGQSIFTEPAPYKSISTRGVDGPVYSADGKRMSYVMDGYLWVRPVDANGVPIGEARPINEEMTDAPSWSADGTHILYLSNGALRIIATEGSAKPVTIAVDLPYQRTARTKRMLIHAGRLWNGLGADVRRDVDVIVAGRRIERIVAHSDELHRGIEVLDASGSTVMPGLWESHNHGYGGLPASGDRAGRLWLAYGVTDLHSQGDGAYGQLEIKESFASDRRVGPRYFSAGEPIDGERGYYAGDHAVTDGKLMQMELSRAQALDYDSVKTYVRLPHELQQVAMNFAHDKLGVWSASHYGMPGLSYGMDGITHVSATSRWGYSYTRSFGGVSYGDIRALWLASGMFVLSTPFASSGLYAEDPKILDDPRFTTLNTPWSRTAMETQRDRAIHGERATGLEGLKREQETLGAILHGGGAVLVGTDSPLPGLAIPLHLAIRSEVKFGMKPWQALQTATLIPARTFGYGKDLGSLEPGKLADITVVTGDPLTDIKDAANVTHVMVDGRMFTMPELLAPFVAK